MKYPSEKRCDRCHRLFTEGGDYLCKPCIDDLQKAQDEMLAAEDDSQRYHAETKR